MKIGSDNKKLSSLSAPMRVIIKGGTRLNKFRPKENVMGHVYDFISSKIDSLVFSEFLPEMFRRVGLNEGDINDLTKLPNWFTSKQWTEKDEQEFKDWLVQRIRYKVKLTKRAATEVANMFILSYGWSTGVEKQLELPLSEVTKKDLI